MSKCTETLSVKGYVAFNQLDGELVIVASKFEAEKLNDFKLPEAKYPGTILYKPSKHLAQHIGKKVSLKLEVLDID